MITMDGNEAAAHVSYAFTDVAAIYPITPSSVMAEHVDEWSAKGRKNIFGHQVKLVEMQSEGGASGAVHGSLAAGALTTTFTASQGLLLMIPNMYKIAGELLPCVIDVSARAVATHALSIFGDHSDVMACRQTGFAMMACSSVQEVMDLTAVSHLSAIKGRVPFLNFFDGFRTSHEIQKVEVWDYDDLKDMVDMDAVQKFRDSALNPEHPVMRGTAQNPDIFFQASEASNKYYQAVPGIVEDYMNQVNAKIGTHYAPFNYYGAPDAETVIVAMGSVAETIIETVDYLNSKGGKYGLVNVHLYRPFCTKRFLAALPKTVKNIAVMDRTKEPGSKGEPLALDVIAAVRGSEFDSAKIVSGRYGLGSKDTTPAQIAAVFKNAESADSKEKFTVGIEDDVTGLSLKVEDIEDTTPKGTTSCKFWGLGSDGTVGANKNSIKIIGDHTDMYAQAYFDYDSKKSGGVTVSHLRFGKSPIHSTYLINKADFVACHNPAYIGKYDMVEDIKKGGTFLINCQWDFKELEAHLPAKDKKYIAENGIKVYTIDCNVIDKKLGLRGRVNTVLQSAFFKLAGIIPEDQAIVYMKEAAKATYGRKGDDVVKMNYDAIDAGSQSIVKIDVPDYWKDSTEAVEKETVEARSEDVKKYVEDVLIPVNHKRGDKLPVSTFVDLADGHVPTGTSAYEKRGIAVNVPEWNPEKCIQCAFCAYVCPHAVIRPVAMTEEELKNAPAGVKSATMMGLPQLKFVMTVSPLDCTGCGSCANVCPGRGGEKALTMKPAVDQMDQQKVFEYGLGIGEKPEVKEKFKGNAVKESQFRKPLLEFSGACGGCGETPYAKLVTQLFGDRMIIANATGCSSIWGGSEPACPYTVNDRGFGPAWANSLFEDNAEYGLGMCIAENVRRNHAVDDIKAFAEKVSGDADKTAVIKAYLDTLDDGEANRKATDDLVAMLEKDGSAEAKELLKSKDVFAKKSIWAFGGDGWAYDIGFGGLDHTLASGENINVLVFDTEVYSNTGGQSSKSTPVGAVAQFAAAGKETKKKDLASIMMSYGYVYVAQVAMGADMQQTVKAIKEAESYNGPSLVIAYAPCINHGIRGGMVNAQTEIKKAVEAGYWFNFRYDPRRAKEGKNPFQLDSKKPTADYKDFIMNEVRYSSLTRTFPERAEKLFAEAVEGSHEKYDQLVERAKDE
jgi:pyruvate-ferredoxin/flavodoxin oxidoreductase